MKATKNAVLTLMAAMTLCTAVSCSKDSTDTPLPDTPSEPAGLVIPQPYFEGYYYGDYYGSGTGNIGFALVNTDNEEVVYFEAIFDASGIGNPDKVSLPEGTYELNDSYAPGTCDIDECYYSVNGSMDFIGFESGTVTVSAAAEGSRIVVDAVLADGKKVNMEYVGPVKTNNNTEEGMWSNLERDVTVTGLTQACMANVGDLVGDSVTESWILSIGDKHYDLQSDWGVGYSVILYLNLEYGLDAVPEGRYDTFIDARTAYELEANTLMTGCKVADNLYGCWYSCPALTDVAALTGGYADITVEDGIYTISGTLSDGYGKNVSFSYKGEVALMEISYDEYADRRPQRSCKVRKNILGRSVKGL